MFGITCHYLWILVAYPKKLIHGGTNFSKCNFSYDGSTITQWGGTSGGTYIIELDGQRYSYASATTKSVTVPPIAVENPIAYRMEIECF